MKASDFLEENTSFINNKLKEKEQLTKLVEVLPRDLEYKNLSIHTSYAEGFVQFEVPTRSDIKKYIKLFPPAPLVLVQNGCTWIQARKNLDRKYKEAATNIFPFYFQLQSWCGEIEREFHWYTIRYKSIIGIRVLVKDDPAGYDTGHQTYTTKDEDGYTRRETLYRWKPRSLPGTESLKFSNSPAPSTPNTFISYWKKDCKAEVILNLL